MLSKNMPSLRVISNSYIRGIWLLSRNLKITLSMIIMMKF